MSSNELVDMILKNLIVSHMDTSKRLVGNRKLAAPAVIRGRFVIRKLDGRSTICTATEQEKNEDTRTNWSLLIEMISHQSGLRSWRTSSSLGLKLIIIFYKE